MNNRFNLYLHLHKGLRAFMADVLTTVGRIDALDAVEVTAGVAQVRALLDACRAHLFTENQFLHIAMEARRRGSSTVTANEHVQQEEALEHIEARLRAIERSSGTDHETKILDLYLHLALSVSENLNLPIPRLSKAGCLSRSEGGAVCSKTKVPIKCSQSAPY
jgi:hypothetical protein